MELEKLARRLGVEEGVRFVGFVADEELPRYYWESSCYVHTTREESFGLSVIEAAYCARPVVAVDEGGVKETVEDGVTGYRVRATAADISRRLVELLARPERGVRMGEAARQRVMERYSWQQGAADLLAVARRLRH